jgi:hypothetical protein
MIRHWALGGAHVTCILQVQRCACSASLQNTIDVTEDYVDTSRRHQRWKRSEETLDYSSIRDGSDATHP